MRNLDHFLDSLVLDKEFRALVIIDEETDDLHAVTKNLGFPVEIIEFNPYVDDKGQRIHRFEPFFADVEAVGVKTVDDIRVQEQRPRDPSELDTIVVRRTKTASRKYFLARIDGGQCEFILRWQSN